MPSFERSASVTIGQRGEKGFLFESPIHIAFKITKSNEPTPNSGTVSIWNLAGYTRDKIRNIGDFIELSAGYLRDDYGVRVVIRADVIGITNIKQGVDIITTVSLGDGVEFLKTIKQAYSFKEGASVKAIIEKIAKAEGITLKSLAGVVDATFANGFSEMGPLGDVLDKLVGKLDAQWSFQNNELQVMPKLGNNGSPVFRIASDTGMIGSPTRDVDTSLVTTAPQSDGWKVSALLRPELGPGDRVEIESDIADASGIYHIKDITHSGDTHGADFTSTMSVRESGNG